MAIELVTCSGCGAKNASHRTICLSCSKKLGRNITWASQSDVFKKWLEGDAPNINPKRVWKGLTFFVRVFALVAAMSAGGWLAGFSVPPDRLTKYDYYEAERWAEIVQGFLKKDQGITTQYPKSGRDWVAEEYERVLLERQWKTRNMIQETSGHAFWASVVLLGLFYWMRKVPYSFDVTLSGLPKIISHTIPYFIARWRVSVLDENGNELSKEFHRTALKANGAAIRLAENGAQLRIVWDTSAYYSYEVFLDPDYQVLDGTGTLRWDLYRSRWLRQHSKEHVPGVER